MSGRTFDKSVSPSGRKIQATSQERPTSEKSSTLGVESKKSKDKSANKKSNDSATNVGGTASSMSGTLKNSKDAKGKKEEKTLGRKGNFTLTSVFFICLVTLSIKT